MTQDQYPITHDRHLVNTEQEPDRLRALARKFFLAWAEKHDEEVEEYGVLYEHTAQDIDVPKTEAFMPGEDEGPEELAKRIRQITGISFEENPELIADFFSALDAPYPYEGGNGRTYLEVLDQDYLSQGHGISVVMGHLDNGLNDVPQATALMRAGLLEAFGDKYLNKVGEVASNTLAYETYKGIPAPEAISMFGDVYWVAPNTESIHDILARSGITYKEYEEIKDYINAKAIKEIVGDLRNGHLIVFSASGTRAKLSPPVGDMPAQLTMPLVDETSAGLITRATALLPIAIVENRIMLGEIKRIDKDIAGLSKDERRKKLLGQLEDSMEEIAALANSIFESTGSPVVTRYSPAAEALQT